MGRASSGSSDGSVWPATLPVAESDARPPLPAVSFSEIIFFVLKLPRWPLFPCLIFFLILLSPPPQDRLVFPSEHVARTPRSNRPLQPPPVAPRAALSLEALSTLGRLLVYEHHIGRQQAMRDLLGPHLPNRVAPRVKVPCHVYGGHPSWEKVIYALLSFYSSSPDRQNEAIDQAKARQSQCEWYRNNIVRLEENRPSPPCLLIPPVVVAPVPPAEDPLVALSAARSLRRLRERLRCPSVASWRFSSPRTMLDRRHR